MPRYSDNSREAGLHREFTKGCLAGQEGAEVQVKCNPPLPGARPMDNSDVGDLSREERMRMLADADRKTVSSNASGLTEKIDAQKRIRKSALDDAISTSGY